MLTISCISPEISCQLDCLFFVMSFFISLMYMASCPWIVALLNVSNQYLKLCIARMADILSSSFARWNDTSREPCISSTIFCIWFLCSATPVISAWEARFSKTTLLWHEQNCCATVVTTNEEEKMCPYQSLKDDLRVIKYIYKQYKETEIKTNKTDVI